MADSVRTWAVIPAAGIGTRMNGDRPKQYLDLAGRPMIAHTVARLASHPAIAGTVVVIHPQDLHWAEVAAAMPDTPVITVHGGAERCHSVLNGLNALANRAAPEDWVMVHDAARPCLRRADVDRLREQLRDDPVGGLLAVPVADTIKRDDGRGRVTETVDRSALWRALTPQMFRLDMLRNALRNALERGETVTDEASAMEAAGFAPRLVPGHADNIKVTLPEDLELAAMFLAKQEAPQ